MNADYIISLYLRNMDGGFRRGFVPLENIFAAGIWVLHGLTCWLTVPIGAGIKTIFDCCTREYTRDQNVRNSVSTAIQDMNEGDLALFIDELESKQYSPQSNSSTWLFNRLSIDRQDSAEQKEKIEFQTLKSDLITYANDKKNNGKMFFQQMVSFFPPKPNSYQNDISSSYESLPILRQSPSITSLPMKSR